MDIILELLDEYVLDDLYAKLLPPSPLPSPSPPSTRSAWLPLTSLPFPISSSDISPTNETLHASSSILTSAWPRDHLFRQILSLSVVTIIGIHLLYFLFAGLSYRFIFNHDMMRHPRFLPNQVRRRTQRPFSRPWSHASHQVRKEIVTSLRSFPGMIALTLPFFLGEVRGWTRLYDRVDDYGWTYLILSVPLFLLFTDYCIYWIHRWLHTPALYKRIHKPHHKWISVYPLAFRFCQFWL